MRRSALPGATRPWLHPIRLAFLAWLLAQSGAPADAQTGSRTPACAVPGGRDRVRVPDRR